MRYELEVEETMRFLERVTVEKPENMSDEEAEDIITKVENKCSMLMYSMGDMVLILQDEYGFNIVNHDTSFPEEPHLSDIKVTQIKKYQ
ncbi:hypothetical protein 000TH008_245 [Bacillus phage 000TH008]|nr:hypothetical protein 000TH008_245 [Bacillus phage 000TH008]QQO40938.1 hypothetical protein 000TH009_245 [Bacillus phage 000TH009]